MAAVSFNGKPRTPDVTIDETWFSNPEICEASKDVANAHIQAYEDPSDNGHYCMVESVVHLSEIVNILCELYPNLQLPERCVDENPYVPTFEVLKEKTRSLGIDYIPMKVSIKETVESLKEKGFIHF